MLCICSPGLPTFPEVQILDSLSLSLRLQRWMDGWMCGIHEYEIWYAGAEDTHL